MALVFDAYVRVSRKGKREKLYSPDEQLEDIDRYLASIGAERGETFRDIDVSGASDNRPSLRAIEGRIKTGHANGLIVAKWDRVARDNWIGQDIPRRVRKAGGTMLSAAEPLDLETPEGRLQYAQAIGFATFFRDRQNVGFERAKERAIEQGIPIMHRIPAGYLRDADTKRLYPCPETAPVVAEVFRMRANRNAGPAECIAHLEAHGVRTGAGSAKWSKTTFYNLLRNRIYLGELSYGVKQRNGGELAPYVNPDAHEPIIDLPTFLAAQPGTRPAQTRAKRPAVLGGIVRCAYCGYVLKAMHETRHGRIYRCGKHHAVGTCPSPVYVSGAEAERLEAVVDDAFWQIVKDRHAHAVDSTAERDAMARELEKAERALTLYRDDPDLEQTMADMGGHEGWREGLRVRHARVTEAKATLAAAERLRPLADVKTLRAEWPKMSAEDRRNRYSEYIDCIALTRPNGGPFVSRVTVYAAGHGPSDLPRRGRVMDGLRPFDLPDAAVAAA